MLDEQREDDGEVVAEGADYAEHDQRQPQLGDAAHVAQPGPHLSLAARCHRDPPQLVGLHHPQGHEHGDVGNGVEDEAPAESDRHDEQTGEGGPEDA